MTPTTYKVAKVMAIPANNNWYASNGESKSFNLSFASCTSGSNVSSFICVRERRDKSINSD